MKKLLSIILAAIMLLSSLSVMTYAENTKENDYPLIIVAGYGSSPLFRLEPDGTSTQLWPLDFGEIGKTVLRRIAEIGIGLGAAAFGSPKMIADTVGKEMVNILGNTACNPDGTSKYNVINKYTTAAECNTAALLEADPDSMFVYEKDFHKEFTKYTSADNIYNFPCDFRMGAVACADSLDKFIQSVKERSGKNKVNIFAISHGGQVTGTYLSLYGYKCDVNNAVLQVPALCGASLVEDIFSQDIHFDELGLIRFIEHGMMCEDDYHWLVEAQQLGFLDGVLNNLVPYILNVIGYWGSIWDFCPSGNYEKYKKQYLDSTESAALIEKSDRMHYEIMPGYADAFAKCQNEYGMNLTILSGTDNLSTTGWQKNGDAIITTECSSGATCADYGERFSDGYIQKNPCDGKYKVSPAMTVDASTAFMPDDTWFIEGMFHGMMFWDNFTRELVLKGLFTDEIQNVYSSPDYPQFHASSNPSNAVWAKFDSSVEGYASSADKSLIIKNVSEKGRNIRLLSVICTGADIKFNIDKIGKIKAGESVVVPFEGELPAVGNKKITVTITYAAPGSVTPLGERELSFTVLNGSPVGYDASKPFNSAKPETRLDKLLPDFIENILKKLGLYPLVSIFYNILSFAFERL